ncbi:Protein COFACTOR ASSEMBLY OF COMPLEX C SUBUNIT B CCB4, chloroplastic, partial [Cucurbita argyrosperma subsp. sororia]
MEAGILFPATLIPWSPNFNCTLCTVRRSFPRIVRASSSSSSLLRTYVGGVSLLVVLFNNRAVSGLLRRRCQQVHRVWKYLSEVACCRFLIVGYDEMCIFQVGFAAESAAGDGEAEHVEAGKLMQGLLYQGILKSQARE